MINEVFGALVDERLGDTFTAEDVVDIIGETNVERPNLAVAKILLNLKCLEPNVHDLFEPVQFSKKGCLIACSHHPENRKVRLQQHIFCRGATKCPSSLREKMGDSSGL